MAVNSEKRVRSGTLDPSALSVLRVLEASQRSMDQGGIPVPVREVVAAARV